MTLLSEIERRTAIDWTSYSGLTLHRKCPQAWTYRYLYRLSKPIKDEAKPELHFGNWFHALRAAEAIDRGRALGSLKHAPKVIRCTDDGPRIPTEVEDECSTCEGTGNERECMDCEGKGRRTYPVENLVAEVFEAIVQWEQHIPEEHLKEWKSKLGSDSPARLLKSLEMRYQRQYKDEIANERPIAVEVKWTRQLPGQDTVLLGYTDEVYFDVKRNLTVVRDHKTMKSLATYGTTADDLLDSQLDLNAWGLAERIKEWGERPVEAVAFNRVCSVKPTTPKLTQKGALSKTVTNFDLMTYLAFCKSPAAIEAGYKPEQSQIERISAPAYQTRFFQRTLRPISRNIIKAHLQAAVDSNSDSNLTIQRVEKRGEAPRNMTGSACRFCDFAQLCRAMMVGGVDGEYEISDYGLRHKESEKALAEVITESGSVD